MFDINDIFKIVLYVFKKNQQGTITSTEFNRLFKIAQLQWATFLASDLAEYQYGRSQPKVEFGMNRTVRTRLTPIIYGYTLSINPTTGLAPYPADYIQVDSMMSIYGVTPIRFVPQHKLASAYNSGIDPIATNPIYLLKDNGIQFYPENSYQAKMSYVRQPPDAVWGFTLDANGREVYSAANSIQPIWDEMSIMEILLRIFKLVGLNLQVPQVVAYAEQIKQTGE